MAKPTKLDTKEAARTLEKLGGPRGGKARADSISPECHREIARVAATKRWHRSRSEVKAPDGSTLSRKVNQWRGELRVRDWISGTIEAHRNSRRLLDDALLLHTQRRFASACSLAIFAIEEAAKP